MSASRFAVASFLGMLPLTCLYNAAGDLVFRTRWVAWTSGGVLVGLFFLLPWSIERYDLFSMRQSFRHDGSAEGGGSAPACPAAGVTPRPE